MDDVNLNRTPSRFNRPISPINKNLITSKDVLVSLFSEEESWAVYYLLNEGITKLDVTEYISHGVSKIQDEIEDDDACCISCCVCCACSCKVREQ